MYVLTNMVVVNGSGASCKQEGPDRLNSPRQFHLTIPLNLFLMVLFMHTFRILRQNLCCSFWNFLTFLITHYNHRMYSRVLIEVLLKKIVKTFPLMMWMSWTKMLWIAKMKIRENSYSYIPLQASIICPFQKINAVRLSQSKFV